MLADPITTLDAPFLGPRFAGPSAPPGQLHADTHTVRFASRRADHDHIRRLRSRGAVQGLPQISRATGLDGLDDALRDGFVHHLLTTRDADGAAVGCLRLTAGSDLWQLSDSRSTYFDLGALSPEGLERAAWVDRVMLDPAELSAGVMWRLLSGLHRYLDWNDLRYLLCPVMVGSDAPSVVAAASLELSRSGAAPARWSAPSQPHYAPDWSSPPAPGAEQRFSPWLMLIRLLGGRLCGGPAVDTTRGATFFLLRLDLRAVPLPVRRTLPGPGFWVPRPHSDPY